MTLNHLGIVVPFFTFLRLPASVSMICRLITWAEKCAHLHMAVKFSVSSSSFFDSAGFPLKVGMLFPGQVSLAAVATLLRLSIHV